MRGADMNPVDTLGMTPDAKRLPCGIESGGVCAKEDNGIAMTSTCQGHLNTGGSVGGGGNFDPANSACSTETSGGETQGIDAPLAVVTDGIGCEVGNDDSNGNTLDSGIDNSDRKRSAPVIVKWPCASCHEGAPCSVRPIDWSASGDRQINTHYDRGSK